MSDLFSPWDAPPQFCAAPNDASLAERITKLAGYVKRNGAEFQRHIKDKQLGNPEYSFLFGGDGSDYYRFVLYCFVNNLSLESATQSPDTVIGALPRQGEPVPHLLQEAQLPPNVSSELSLILSELSGSKDSIKNSQKWFLQNYNHAVAMVSAIAAHYRLLNDYPRMLHVIYMTSDILVHSLQMAATKPELPGIVQKAIEPFLPEMLSLAYAKSGRQDEVRDRLSRIVKLWSERGVYTADTVSRILTAGFQDPEKALAMEAKVAPEPHAQQQHNLSAVATPWQGQTCQPEVGAMPPYSYSQGMPAPHSIGQAVPWAMGPVPHQPVADAPIGSVPQAPWLAAVHQHSGLHLQPPMHSMPHMPVSQDQHVALPPWQQAQLPPPLTASIAAPASGNVPPAAPWNTVSQTEQQISRQEQPVNPMCFPPGVLASLLKFREEEPYEPLGLEEIQHEGLPEPNEPDAFLRSRIEKFYSEVSGYYGTKTRSQVLSDRGQDPRGMLPSMKNDSGLQVPGAPQIQDVDSLTGMQVDGSFVKPKGDRTKGGLGSHKPTDDNTDPDDVYGMYRKGRSSVYHSSGFAAKARR